MKIWKPSPKIGIKNSKSVILDITNIGKIILVLFEPNKTGRERANESQAALDAQKIIDTDVNIKKIKTIIFFINNFSFLKNKAKQKGQTSISQLPR